MIAPVRPKMLDTGIDTAHGVSQTGAPPDIVRTCPSEDPLMMPIEFPTRVSPFVNVRGFSFVLNVFQSAAERAPTVVDDARVRESSCPESVSQFAIPRVSGECARREREATVHESVVMSDASDAIDPESVVMSARTPATVPEREVRSEVRFETVFVTVYIFPESVVRVASRVLTTPERDAIWDVCICVVPESVSTVDEREKSDPERKVYCDMSESTVPESDVIVL